jgi:hypothetical protein
MCLPLLAAVPALATLGAGAAGVGTAATIGGVSLSTIGAVGSLLGTGLSAISSVKQGQAQAASANYQAQMAERNAQIARQNSSMSAAAAEAQIAQQGMKDRAKFGAIKAAQAASGVDVNSGSAVDIQSSQAEMGELNAISLENCPYLINILVVNEMTFYEQIDSLVT